MILITGANGFIGNNLSQYLKTKYELLIPSSSSLNLLNTTQVQIFFKTNKIDAVIHCAAYGSVVDPTISSDVIISQNLLMFKNIVETAQKNTLIINMGSGAEYDKSRELKRVKETQFGECIPKDPYGYSKYLISKEIEKHENVVNLRLFGVYGPYENFNRFPSYATRKLISKKPIEINQDVVFSYLFIEDLCKIVECFLKCLPKNKYLNVVPCDTISLTEICDILCSIMHVDVSVLLKNQTLNKEYSGNNEKLLTELKSDFKFSSCREALLNLVKYHSENMRIYEN